MVLNQTLERRIDALKKQLAKYKGKWEKEEYRCPQCGTGNPRIAQLEAKNKRLSAALYDALNDNPDYAFNSGKFEDVVLWHDDGIAKIDALKEGE